MNHWFFKDSKHRMVPSLTDVVSLMKQGCTCRTSVRTTHLNEWPLWSSWLRKPYTPKRNLSYWNKTSFHADRPSNTILNQVTIRFTRITRKSENPVEGFPLTLLIRPTPTQIRFSKNTNKVSLFWTKKYKNDNIMIRSRVNFCLKKYKFFFFRTLVTTLLPIDKYKFLGSISTVTPDSVNLPGP